MDDHRRDLLFLLHDVARLMRIEGDKRARQRGMTRAQWVILIWLDRSPGLSQKEVAEMLEVEPITVARLVDRLEARGMVERRPDPSDRRVWRLHALPPARAVLDEIAVHKAEMLDMVTAGLDAETQQRLIDALLRMKENICAERRADLREIA
jgi:MarR family transcriptional regulator, transcriptional regulator for hemolysin